MVLDRRAATSSSTTPSTWPLWTSTTSRSPRLGPSGRRPDRLGRRAEPLLPGPARDDAVLGARLHPDPRRTRAVKGKVGAAPMIGRARRDRRRPRRLVPLDPRGGQAARTLAKEFIEFAYDNNDLSIETALGLAATKSAFESVRGPSRPREPEPADRDAGRVRPRCRARPTRKWQQIVDTVLSPDACRRPSSPAADNQVLLDDAQGPDRGHPRLALTRSEAWPAPAAGDHRPTSPTPRRAPERRSDRASDRPALRRRC